MFGPGFGFALGCTSLFASALVTAGVGPWLPYQMLVPAWVGMGAGLLPRRVTGRNEIVMLAAYGVVSAYAFGLLMNLSGWPFALGIAVPGHEGSLDFVAGAPLAENLQRFAVYTLLTSTGSFDTGRDHHRRGHRGPRPGGAHDAAPRVPPGVDQYLLDQRGLMPAEGEPALRRLHARDQDAVLRALRDPEHRRLLLPLPALSLTATLCSFVIFLPA